MPRITEELVRKRAEHNDGDIATLEELSLHQQDLERIEHLDRWCRHLKILYLQNNLIPRIENVGRLKDLQYLNLALNNVEKIENLKGCEFLQKLDFTVNFIGDLISVESLRCNLHLQELYLTGNPCTTYEGYREFVLATLPQLLTLDGKEITKSERISASQHLKSLRNQIKKQQEEHALKREREKEAFREKHSTTEEKQRKPGFDGRWYTDPQAHVCKEKEVGLGGKVEGVGQGTIEEGEKDHMARGEEEELTDEEEPYTPEYRLKSHREMEKIKMQQAKEPDNKLEMPKRIRTLEREGKLLNVNEGRYIFHLLDEGSHYVLEVECPKYMDTSFIDCDLQTTYVRLNIKSKILQLVFEEEISPDSSSAKRSQTTGHLLLHLPKAKPFLQAHSKSPTKLTGTKKADHRAVKRDEQEMLVTQPPSNITRIGEDITETTTEHSNFKKHCDPCSSKFEDDPDVPPLV